jgi:hypothetical protein
MLWYPAIVCKQKAWILQDFRVGSSTQQLAALSGGGLSPTAISQRRSFPPSNAPYTANPQIRAQPDAVRHEFLVTGHRWLGSGSLQTTYEVRSLSTARYHGAKREYRHGSRAASLSGLNWHSSEVRHVHGRPDDVRGQLARSEALNWPNSSNVLHSILVQQKCIFGAPLLGIGQRDAMHRATRLMVRLRFPGAPEAGWPGFAN